MQQNVSVTMQFKDAPGPGYKSWSFKDTAGRKFYASEKVAAVIPIGQPINLVVEEGVSRTGKSYYSIKGLSQVPSAPQQSYQAPVNTPNNTQSGIPQVAGMAAMAVVGKLYQGTGAFPGRQIIAQQFLDVAMAWMDAEIAMKNYKAQGGADPADEIPPF